MEGGDYQGRMENSALVPRPFMPPSHPEPGNDLLSAPLGRQSSISHPPPSLLACPLADPDCHEPRCSKNVRRAWNGAAECTCEGPKPAIHHQSDSTLSP